jgi:hypothetical protein
MWGAEKSDEISNTGPHPMASEPVRVHPNNHYFVMTLLWVRALNEQAGTPTCAALEGSHMCSTVGVGASGTGCGKQQSNAWPADLEGLHQP